MNKSFSEVVISYPLSLIKRLTKFVNWTQKARVLI